MVVQRVQLFTHNSSRYSDRTLAHMQLDCQSIRVCSHCTGLEGHSQDSACTHNVADQLIHPRDRRVVVAPHFELHLQERESERERERERERKRAGERESCTSTGTGWSIGFHW